MDETIKPISPWAVGGQAVGGGLQGISDFMGQMAQSRANEASAKGTYKGTQAVAPMIEDAWSQQQGMWSPLSGMAGQGAIDSYTGMINDPYWSQDPEAFKFDKTMQDYIDPALQYRIDQGIRGLDTSAANQGGLFSSGHGRDVTAFGQEEASKENVLAQERFRQDRGQAYSEYNDFLKNQMDRRQGRINNATTGLNLGMQGMSNLSQQRGNYDTSRIGNTMDQFTAQGNIDAAKKQRENAMLRGGLSLLGGVATGAGKAVGG